MGWKKSVLDDGGSGSITILGLKLAFNFSCPDMNELSNVKIKKITLQKLAHILSVLKEREKKSLIKNYDSMRQQTRIQLMYIVDSS